MGKPAVLGRAVPVFDPGRNVHHVAGLERQRGLFPLLVPAASSGYEKNLPAFVVDVPEKEFPGNCKGQYPKVSVFSTGACDAFKEIKI